VPALYPPVPDRPGLQKYPPFPEVHGDASRRSRNMISVLSDTYMFVALAVQFDAG
jgi:hypothetical protein